MTSADRIAESFHRQRLLATLGARLLHVADGEVDIELPWSDAIQQQHGFAHAGAIASIADSSCGYACLTRMPEGSAVLSVEFKINLLAPAVGETFIARGRVVRMGRTIGVATSEIVALGGGAGAGGRGWGRWRGATRSGKRRNACCVDAGDDDARRSPKPRRRLNTRPRPQWIIAPQPSVVTHTPPSLCHAHDVYAFMRKWERNP